MLPGEFRIFVRIDSGNEVGELNEQNNTFFAGQIHELPPSQLRIGSFHGGILNVSAASLSEEWAGTPSAPIQFPRGAEVQLTARSARGMRHVGWLGAGFVDGSTLSFNLDDDREIAPLFESLPSVSYDEWKVTQFSPSQLADEFISGKNADADEDGRTNIVEFALGSRPSVADGLPPLQVSVEGANQVVLSFTRSWNHRVNLTLQQSIDMTVWTPVDGIILSDSSEGENTRYRLRPTQVRGTKFYRLSVFER